MLSNWIEQQAFKGLIELNRKPLKASILLSSLAFQTSILYASQQLKKIIIYSEWTVVKYVKTNLLYQGETHLINTFISGFTTIEKINVFVRNRVFQFFDSRDPQILPSMYIDSSLARRKWKKGLTNKTQ